MFSSKGPLISFQISFLLKTQISKIYSIIEKKLKIIKFLAFQKIIKPSLQLKRLVENKGNSLYANNKIPNDSIEDLYLMGKITQKIKYKTKYIYDLYHKKLLLTKQSYFIKWREMGKNHKNMETIKNELEKRVRAKFSLKIDEFDKELKKLNQESISLKHTLDNFKEKLALYQNKINQFDIKEKEILIQNKIYMEDKRKIVDELNQANTELKSNYFKIESYLNELEKSFHYEKENQTEKEIFLNNYVNEMNSLLDFYEMKSSKFYYSNRKNFIRLNLI